jgi:hypothetical protein
MARAEDFAPLKEIAEYRAAHRLLRRGAIGSLVFGGLTLGIGLSGAYDSFLTGVGAVLICTGVWSFFTPRPIGIVIDGIALVTVGGYNLSTLAVAMLGQWVPGGGLWGVVGVLQFVLGVHGFARLLQLGGVLRTQPTEAELREFDEIAVGVWNGPSEAFPFVIELAVDGFRSAAGWKVCLDPEEVIIVSSGGAQVHVCERDSFDIEVGDEATAEGRTVKIRVGAKERRGTIDQASLERFHAWKSDAAMPQEAAA